MHVIIGLQEAEIRRVVVQTQPGQNSFRDPTSKKAIIKKG
jgi:hypothetical protein